ncbi:MAG: Gfo/Idh/MocA family oxidoreductase [Lentisphaeria bacterium]|nr:Gfo/Idh/MocA family oxidoreductase [Lentisphaeria bacterium]
MKKLKLAIIGCGNRSRIYSRIASEQTERYEIVAAADPNNIRLAQVEELSNNSGFRSFHSAMDLLSCKKLADLVIIGTQDNYHYEPCKKALEQGYDVLLEKPISPSIEEILELESLAIKLNRRLQVCYVLRYTPFYKKVKEIIDSGQLGDIISINAVEGVIPWHQAHSYVRGNWNQEKKSSPMIVAKCSHDMDILSWLTQEECTSISSYGSLTHFNAKNAPKQATTRCTDGCPIVKSCHYSAYKYSEEHRTPWLEQVYDNALNASSEEIEDWLKTSNFGRCVYHSDNTVVDHQVVAMEFKNETTATLTMTAFEEGRQIEIYGTKGVLKGGHFLKVRTGKDIIVKLFSGDEVTHTVNIDSTDHHMGGDQGIIDALYSQMTQEVPVPVSSYIQSHVMSYAAEESRLSGNRIELRTFKEQYTKMDRETLCTQ